MSFLQKPTHHLRGTPIRGEYRVENVFHNAIFDDEGEAFQEHHATSFKSWQVHRTC